MNLKEESGRKELGRRIQSAIAEAGFTSLPAFADTLGCSRALIYQYISGRVLVQLDRLCAIAETTGKPLDWFVVDDPNGSSGEVEQLKDRVAELTEECENLEAVLTRERGARLNDAKANRESLLAALQELCRAQRRAGDVHALSRTAARCADLARSLGDEVALMTAHVRAGHAAIGLGQRDEAEAELEAALELAEEFGDTRVAMAARQELVRVLQAAGRLEDALHHAVAVMGSDLWWYEWSGWVAIAAIDEQGGHPELAAGELENAEKLANSPNAPADRALMAHAYIQSNRVNCLLAQGLYEEADAAAQRLQELAAEAGLPDQVREGMLDRGIAALRMGDYDRAADLLERVREGAEMTGDRRLQGLARVFEAERLVAAGDAAAARRLAMDAIEMGNEAVSGQIVAEAELVLGVACRADGMIDDASHHLKRARERAHRLKLKRVEVAAQVQQALLKLEIGDDGAEEALVEAHAIALRHEYGDLVRVAEQAFSEHFGDIEEAWLRYHREDTQ